MESKPDFYNALVVAKRKYQTTEKEEKVKVITKLDTNI